MRSTHVFKTCDQTKWSPLQRSVRESNPLMRHITVFQTVRETKSPTLQVAEGEGFEPSLMPQDTRRPVSNRLLFLSAIPPEPPLRRRDRWAPECWVGIEPT